MLAMTPASSSRDSKVKILVAEDSPTQAEQIRFTLESHHYRVEVARNGKLALEKALEMAPTLIVSDIVMPEMDGYELCRQVKTRPELKDTPVILLTSLSDPVDVVRGLECGADNFLVKPCNEDCLISQVSFILANRHLRQRDFAQMGVEILFAGNKYFITSDRLQILNLLLSTYETAIQKNRELFEAQEELKALAESLDEKVRVRTAQLQAEVDERRRAEEELQQGIERERQLSEQLQQAQKLEAIGLLAGGIAHDFNNLLSIIIGYSELLLEKDQNEKSARYLHQINKAGQRAAALTSQLLAFSRKSIIKLEAVNINDVIIDIEKMLRRLIGEDIELSTFLQPGLACVKADPTQMEQVIMNLAVNARDAMPSGGKLHIETRNVRLDEPYADARIEIKPGNYILLAVSDNGMGMDAATKARIFEPFFTTKGPGKGTGLGLATIYGIVKQIGGHIGVYSEVGMGTVFKIHLPAMRESAIFPVVKTPEPQKLEGTETILIVEDEESVRQLCRIALGAYGYRVLEAPNGPAALALLEKEPRKINLLITDVVMPHMSGRELAETLLARDGAMKALYLSGYTDDAVVRYGVLEAETAFLQKPFTPSALARRVRETLDATQGKEEIEGIKTNKE